MIRGETEILIVTDGEPQEPDLEGRLRSLGYTACTTVHCGRGAVEAAGRGADLALVDLGAGGGSGGIETAEQLRDELGVPVVYLTDWNDEGLHRAEASQPYGFVLKPVDTRQLDLSIRSAMAIHDREAGQRQGDRALRRTIGELRRKARIMDTILNSTRDGVVAADGAGRILFVNSQAEHIVGTVADMKPGELHDASERQKRYGLFELDRRTLVPTHELPLVRALQGKTTDDKEVFIRNDRVPQGVYISVTGRTLWSDERREIEGGVVFFRDVTRQREAEADLQQTLGELHDQTHLMGAVFESMEEAIFVTSTDGGLMWANSRMEQLIGAGITQRKPSEWSRAYGFYDPDGESLMAADRLPILRVLRGESLDDEALFIRSEHRPEGLHATVSGRPLRGDDGEIRAGVVVFHDVTAQKVAELRLEETVRELRDQTQLMRTVFDNMEEGVLVADTAGNFLLTNSRREQIVGMKLIASEPDDWPATFGAFYLDRKTQVPTGELPLVRAMRGEATEEVELFVRNERRPDGAYVRARGRPLRDGSGNVVGGVAIFSDITKYKETESELERTIRDLQAQAQLMEATFNGISDGLAIVDTEGEVLNVNPMGRQIAGIESMPASQARRLINWGTYYFPDRETLIPFEDLPLKRVISRGERVSDMDVFVRNENKPDGFFVRLSARPLLHAEGGIRGGVMIFRDVTDQIHAEEALTRAFAQGRLEIIDTILHNVGNAINSVTTGIGTLQARLNHDRVLLRLRGLAERLEAHGDDWVDYLTHDPQGRKVVPYIRRLVEACASQNEAVARTVARVGDRAHHIADIIRTQRALDKPHMSRKDIDLEDAFGAAVRVVRESLDKRGIAVEIRCDGAPREIRIQESQFHQMMVNLMKNAIEAIDELAAAGGLEETPRISVRAYPEGDFLHLDVADNGIGIDGKNFRLMFAAGYSTKESGSGLGLHSAANFVIGAGGQIHALSGGPGKGTTLRVMLRLSSIVPGKRKAFAASGRTD